MDEQNIQTVPYVVYESTTTKDHLTIKRLIIAIIVILSLFFATNAIWIVTSYDFDEKQVVEATQDGSGTNLVGGGDIIYGATSENHND